MKKKMIIAILAGLMIFLNGCCSCKDKEERYLGIPQLNQLETRVIEKVERKSHGEVKLEFEDGSKARFYSGNHPLEVRWRP